MFNKEELDLIAGVLKQLSFRPGASQQMKLVEGMLEKIEKSNIDKGSKADNK